MGFIVRMYDTTREQAVMIGRVPSATEALALLRRWRNDHPRNWVEVTSLAIPRTPEAA